MDKDQIDDLKQFIESVFYSSVTTFRKELIDEMTKKFATKEDLNRLEGRLIARMDDGFGGIASTFDDVVDPQLDDHEKRITMLEGNAT